MKLNDGRVVPAFMDQALKGEPITIFGDGSQTRSFCYVSDMVDGLYRLLLSTEEYPVNLGNPREMTISEFAETIIAMTGSRAGVVHHGLPEDDPKQRRPDITKARRVLGWNPVVPFGRRNGPYRGILPLGSRRGAANIKKRQDPKVRLSPTKT